MDKQAPIIIDIEASGFGKSSYPIEVGFVSEKGEGWCSLIRPENDWQHWDTKAEQVHRIQRELLLERGKPAAFVAEQLNDLLHGRVVYTDGWAHDYVWMARLFDAANRVPFFRLEDLRTVLTPAQQNGWHEAKSAVEKELQLTRHRASTDALVLQMTWMRTMQAAGQPSHAPL